MTRTEMERIRKLNEKWMARECDGRTCPKNGKFGTVRNQIIIKKSKVQR